MIRRAILTTVGAGAAIAIMAQSGQAPSNTNSATKGMLATLSPNEIDTIRMATRLGSFRLIDGVGKVEITFTGTVLISQLKGVKTVTGNVRMEYPRNEKEKKMGREVWFGTGKIVVDGSFRAIQWFGKDMNAVWTGAGQMRLYGEFDDKLNTGTYVYDSEKVTQYWSPYGTNIPLPPPRDAGRVKPNIKKSGG